MRRHHYSPPTISKFFSWIIGVAILLTFALSTIGAQTNAYAVKIDNRTGIWFDSQKAIAPQLESGMLLQKKNMSETEFRTAMENVSDASARMVSSCSSTFSELLRGLCDFSLSMISVMCKTETNTSENKRSEIPKLIFVTGLRKPIEERFWICLQVLYLTTALISMF